MYTHLGAQGRGTWAGRGGAGAGQSSRRCCLSGVLQNEEFTGRTRNSRQKEQHVQRYGALLRLQGAEYAGAQGMCGGGQEEHTGRARPAGEEPHTPFLQRRGFVLQATGRPGRICGVEGSNQMCVLERSLWLRVEENGVEAGRQGGGCGQSREMTTVARPEPWQ